MLRHAGLNLVLQLSNRRRRRKKGDADYADVFFKNEVFGFGFFYLAFVRKLIRTNLLTGEFETYLAANSPIMGGGITEIEKGPGNALWFVSENAGVFHLKNGEWTHYYDQIIPEPNNDVKYLQVLPGGDVWFFVSQSEDQNLSRLIRIRDGEVTSFGNLPEDLKSFAIINENTIFISNGDTIHRYDAAQEQVVEVYHSGNSIILPDETFSIRPDHDLSGFERIFNKASIYFDFNLPVVTNNTQWNVVDDLAVVSTKEVHGNISIYPNPTQRILFLTINKESEYQIWDGAGRKIDAGLLQSGTNNIQLDTESGVYYLQVKSGDEVYVPVKVVVIRKD